MKIQLLLILALMLTFSFDAVAVNSTVTAENATALTIQKDSKTNIFTKMNNWKNKKVLKAKTWAVNKLAALDLDDPGSVIKMAIVCILGGILISIVGAFTLRLVGYLGWLIFVVGVALFWYWVYLKFLK